MTSPRRIVWSMAQFAIPFAWLGLFFLAPFIIVLKLSVADTVVAIPPYTPLFEVLHDGSVRLLIHWEHYARLWQDSLYIQGLTNSMALAGLATLIALMIGLAMAYAMTRAPRRYHLILVMLVILPFWTSFLIRVYAWVGILKTEGVLNTVLQNLGVMDTPWVILNTNAAVVIGMVYAYLPFMVLPIYATLEKMDASLLEAALDLGCRPVKRFFTVVVPLVKSGIMAGCVLVFVPAVGEFVIPDLLGGSDTLMIGSLLWAEFFNNRDWPLAAAVTVVLLVCLVVPVVWWQRSVRAF